MGGTDQFYRIVTTEPNTTLEIASGWGGSADVDIVLCNDVCDTGLASAGTTNNPEIIEYTFVNPGTYVLYNFIYSGAPTYYYVQVTGIPTPAP